MCLLGQALLRGVEEVGVGTLRRTADAAPQLVELCEPEQIGTLHDEGVDLREIQSRLDDRRAYLFERDVSEFVLGRWHYSVNSHRVNGIQFKLRGSVSITTV